MRGGDDAGRVPGEHREGRGVGAPIPEGAGGADVVRGDGGDIEEYKVALRGPSQRALHGRGRGGVREADVALCVGPGLAGQGDRRVGRGRGTRPHSHGEGAGDGGEAGAGDRGGEGEEEERGETAEFRGGRFVPGRGEIVAATVGGGEGAVGGGFAKTPHRGDGGEYRRGGGHDDGGPGEADSPHGGGEAVANGRGAGWKRRGTGRGDRQGGEGDSPEPRGAEGSEPPHWLVHFLGPDRSGEDTVGKGVGALSVRHGRRVDPHRHERVHGEVRRFASGRRASGIRGLRGGGTVDGEGEKEAVLGGVVGRDREGSSGRVQHSVAVAGRRAVDGQFGT